MALFAKTSKTIEIIGKNIPIPFSETAVSPDKVCDTYTNTPNKKRFVKILSRPNTNCNFLLLYKNMVTKESIAEMKNAVGIAFCNIVVVAKRSTEKTVAFTLFHKLKTKVSPPEIIPTTNKYKDCILCIMFFYWSAKLLFLFLKRNFVNQNIYLYLLRRITSRFLISLKDINTFKKKSKQEFPFSQKILYKLKIY